jgi:hypothetical protein
MSAPQQTTNVKATSTAPAGENAQQHQHQHPGLVSGHVQYAKGFAEDLVGSLTGSQPWKASAAHDKEHAVESMRSAAQDRDPAAHGYGKAEEVAGRAVGCGGMQREGAASVSKKDT